MVYRKIASLLLLFVTIGFFLFHAQRAKPLEFVASISPSLPSAEMIVANEFLLLMDPGDEKYLSDVLEQFDLELIAPLGEWVHVRKRGGPASAHAIPLSSKKGQEQSQFLATLAAHPAVHSAHLNYLENKSSLIACDPLLQFSPEEDAVGQKIPRDPYFPFQWHLSKDPGIDLVGAWAITTGSESVVIALVDRNFDSKENDLSPERCDRHYFYENVTDYFPHALGATKAEDKNHGSYVLSALAPCTNNSVGLSGVDWHAQVFLVDSVDDSSFSARLFGMLWAAGIDVCKDSIVACPDKERFQINRHPANVINSSFGFAGGFLKDPPYGPVLDVISRINRQGQIVVASAGNEASRADRRLPGSAGGVISVASSNEAHQASAFSNFGRTVDVSAPGEHIVGLKQGQPISLNGTSFSSPIVAGVVSLMLAVNPELSFKTAEYILKKTAKPLSCESACPSTMKKPAQEQCQKLCCHEERSICSSGIVDARAAVQMARLGVPELALLDVDDYFIPLSDDNDLMATITIKNWGRKRAWVRMKPTDRHLKLEPELLQVAASGKNGMPGLNTARVFYEPKPEHPVVLSLILEAADEDKPEEFHDQIEAIVEIVPDPKLPRKKQLRELLPGRLP